jgi:uncharacterized glyoxalase superfamily protein PhnB
MENNVTNVWPVLAYRDAPAAISFLTDAFGFVAGEVHKTGDGAVVHAELRRPEGGGVMLSTAGKDDGPFGKRAAGNDAVYVVSTDPDALFARATVAGAEVVIDLHDTDYGSRDFTVRDPEGNLWSFGTYAGS